ncbi:MAG: phosphoribosylformylglycinamidine synthase subunit PurS [Synergistaceae bacterium]|jgi:phosphoribosylformylglycinamidine synthase|nr:phosphoribosylformylglycinamidine synthase subunit PurS [Synergistaceae bacterium]
MMRFRVDVTVLPKDGVLDIQGKAVEHTLKRSGYSAVDDVRVGRFIRFSVEAKSESAAGTLVDSAADDLLANGLIESYTYKLERIQ